MNKKELERENEKKLKYIDELQSSIESVREEKRKSDKEKATALTKLRVFEDRDAEKRKKRKLAIDSLLWIGGFLGVIWGTGFLMSSTDKEWINVCLLISSFGIIGFVLAGYLARWMNYER
ncbi:MAG: hypothetical protein OEX12_11525 [Gammaproteobacteria bacterium]|nr:hypothetical protein [Gammaproteobacteria bacterium]